MGMNPKQSLKGIVEKQRLVGTITRPSLLGTLSNRVELLGEIHVANIIDRTKDPYEGEYTVSPTFVEQVLLTKDLKMTDDLTVNAIKVERVTNEAGGKTVIIGV